VYFIERIKDIKIPNISTKEDDGEGEGEDGMKFSIRRWIYNNDVCGYV
jgi:hypothetical protein